MDTRETNGTQGPPGSPRTSQSTSDCQHDVDIEVPKVRTPGNTKNMAGMVVSEPTDIVERSKEILGLRSRRVGKRLATLMVFKAKHGRAAGISHRTPSKHERTLSTGAPIDGQPPTNLMKFIGLGEGCRSIGSPVDRMRSYSKVVVRRTPLQKHRSGRKSAISSRIWT